jgi:hypothetical protein
MDAISGPSTTHQMANKLGSKDVQYIPQENRLELIDSEELLDIILRRRRHPSLLRVNI